MKRLFFFLALCFALCAPQPAFSGGPTPLENVDITGTISKVSAGAFTIKSGALFSSEAGANARLAKLYVGTTVTTNTALLQLDAGGTAAGSAPFKFTLGGPLTTPEAGALEYDGSFFYVTSSAPTRQRVSTDAATSAISASAINWSLSGTFSKTLAANTTFTFSNAVDGKTIVVALTNTTGNYTVTWPTVSWTGGTAPVQTIGAKTDVYTLIKIGSTTYGSVIPNF
jgi:hypothetical protein